jgi:alpha-galactosidase/6-phospho-beta-glucosidase family protein
MKIVIFGGTAHSTPALWSYLTNETPVDGLEMILAARDANRLEVCIRACKLLAGEGANRISGASITGACGWEALEAADLVLIQIRNGGYKGRTFDEQFPLQYGIPGDEGLGPGGLSAGVRNWPVVRDVLKQVSLFAPSALVLMLSSPVGLLVRAAKREFPSIRSAGICELPWTTLIETCRDAGCQAEDAQFDYFGINHLGWLYSVASGLGPIASSVPLKYRRLHDDQQNVVQEQRRGAERPRGAVLEEISRRAFATYINGDRAEVGRFLEMRPAPWYRYGVGPFIAGMAGWFVRTPFFLSVPNDGLDTSFADDDVLEYAHSFEGSALRRKVRCQSVPKELLEATTPFVEYERFGTVALLKRDFGHIHRALSAHPWVKTPEVARDMAADILRFSMPEARAA